MIDDPDRRWISPEEYLTLERLAEIRGEYRDGRIRRLRPSNLAHNRIVTNLIGEIGNQLKGHSYAIMAINMRILVRETGFFAYPDLVIIDDRPEFLDREEDTLLNPFLIIEILSPATEDWDRNVKSAHYRRLASLNAYILVSQSKILVEHHYRQEGDRALSVASQADESLHLASIGCEVPLSHIYARVFPRSNPMHRGGSETQRLGETS